MENVNMTMQTKEQRLAIIKAVAEKVKARNEFKTKARASASLAKVMVKDIVKAKDKKFAAALDKMDENHNHWTDANKYAEQYYGEVYRDTTRYDNEWN